MYAVSGGIQKKEARDRAETVVSMIPPGVQSVLEVGCGDGIIINQVGGKNTMGVDISAKGLDKVTGPSMLAFARDLPFEDRSWDLVIASEVIEHILDEEYERSLGEIARVAGKHILITVPNRENLALDVTRCPECGATFHAFYHLRSYGPEKLRPLFDGFVCETCKEQGPRGRRSGRLEMFIRHRIMKKWAPFVNSKCPDCGYSRYVRLDKEAELPVWYVPMYRRAITWLPRKLLGRKQRETLVALYQRDVASSE